MARKFLYSELLWKSSWDIPDHAGIVLARVRTSNHDNSKYKLAFHCPTGWYTDAGARLEVSLWAELPKEIYEKTKV